MIIIKKLRRGKIITLRIAESLNNVFFFFSRWKETFDEMTEQLQKELQHFQKENSSLKEENFKLKTALMQIESSTNKSTEKM